jgi:hypothetical protein
VRTAARLEFALLFLPHLCPRADTVPHSGQTTCGLQHALRLFEWFVCFVPLPHLNPRADPSYSRVFVSAFTYVTPRTYLAPHFGPSTCGLLHTLHVLIPFVHVFHSFSSHFTAVAFLSVAHVCSRAHHTFTTCRPCFFIPIVSGRYFLCGGALK